MTETVLKILHPVRFWGLGLPVLPAVLLCVGSINHNMPFLKGVCSYNSFLDIGVLRHELTGILLCCKYNKSTAWIRPDVTQGSSQFKLACVGVRVRQGNVLFTVRFSLLQNIFHILIKYCTMANGETRIDLSENVDNIR